MTQRKLKKKKRVNLSGIKLEGPSSKTVIQPPKHRTGLWLSVFLFLFIILGVSAFVTWNPLGREVMARALNLQ